MSGIQVNCVSCGNPMPKPEGAEQDFGADAAYPLEELTTRLHALLQGYTTLHHSFGVDKENDKIVREAIERARRLGKNHGTDFPESFQDSRIHCIGCVCTNRKKK